MTDVRARVAEALTRIEAHIPTTGPSAGLINADSFADAVIELCGPIFRDEYARILTGLIADLRSPYYASGAWLAKRLDEAEAHLRGDTE